MTESNNNNPLTDTELRWIGLVLFVVSVIFLLWAGPHSQTFIAHPDSMEPNDYTPLVLVSIGFYVLLTFWWAWFSEIYRSVKQSIEDEQRTKTDDPTV